MGFVSGFLKIASEHRQSGLLALSVHPGAAAVYSHMKAPAHRRKSPEQNYLKHRLEQTKGWALGTAAGGAAGALGGLLGQRAYAATKGHKSHNYHVQVPLWLAKALKGEKAVQSAKGRSVPLIMLPIMAGTLLGGQVGAYYGAKRGHTAVTGKPEK